MAIAVGELQAYRVGFVPRGTDVTRRQARALRTLRARSGLTQEQVAALIPMKIDTYRGYEKGYSELKLGQLPQFAGALGVSVAALMQAVGLMTLNAREIHLNDMAALAERLEGVPESAADFVIQNAMQLVEFAEHRERDLNN